MYVCTGNICRSPLAQHLTTTRLGQLLGADACAFRVMSAGTRAVVGYEMDPAAARQLRRLGGVAGDFRARQMRESLVQEADLILSATRTHRGSVLEEEPRALRRTFTMREFADLVNRASVAASLPALVADIADRRGDSRLVDYDVPDPIGASDEVHAEVADVIYQAVCMITDAVAKVVTAGR